MEREIKAVALVMEITSLSKSADTAFTRISNAKAVKAFERVPQIAQNLPQLLAAITAQDAWGQLQKSMFENGNYLDIQAELDRQVSAGLGSDPNYSRWQAIAKQIADIQYNPVFHFT